MFMDLNVGELNEPLTGRRWDPSDIQRELSRRLTFFLQHGLAPGDRVFLHYGNALEFFVDLLAIWSLGGCAVPIDSRLTEFEIKNLAEAAKPRFSIWQHALESAVAKSLSSLQIKVLETLAPASKKESVSRWPSFASNLVSLDQPALILFTSGTTGQPKGVVHSHRSLRAKWMSLRQSLGTEKFRRTLCLLPTHFGHGLICNCLFPWLFGKTLYIAPPFKPELVMQLGSLLDDHEITFMSSVPSVWRLALKTARPPRFGKLERVFCGSAPLSACLWKSIQEWTGTREVMNAYGITETGSWVAGTMGKDVTPEDGLIGEGWGTVIKVLKTSSTDIPPGLMTECANGESGHVWLNTPALMQGYLGRDDLTNKVVSQGWFLTGDIGLIDDRGLLYLRGREREEINKGGMKVYPCDIDAVAERYEETLDVCTFPYEDTLNGEDIGIAVVLKQINDENVRGLYTLLKSHLAKFQMPQRWYFLSEIPRTSRGKVNRMNVAEKCSTLEPIDVRSLVRTRR
jgi:acyl-CoA synthetase (AMP-forming)/AMP-acid ligase II